MSPSILRLEFTIFLILIVSTQCHSDDEDSKFETALSPMALRLLVRKLLHPYKRVFNEESLGNVTNSTNTSTRLNETVTLATNTSTQSLTPNLTLTPETTFSPSITLTKSLMHLGPEVYLTEEVLKHVGEHRRSRKGYD